MGNYQFPDDHQFTDEERERIVATLFELEAEADKHGWDAGTQLWTIVQSPDGTLTPKHTKDPFQEIDGAKHDHPAEVLNTLYGMGMRCTPEVLALVMVSEGYRHRFIEEIIDDPVDDQDREFAQQWSQLREAFSTVMTEEEIRATQGRAWSKIITQMPQPSTLPANKRREIRTAMAVLSTGESIAVMRARAQGNLPERVERMGWATAEQTVVGRIPAAMLQLLTWQDQTPTGLTETIIDSLNKRKKETQ